MGYGQKINKVCWSALLMLLLWIGYIGGVSLFPHNHIVDGHRITHSHPYSGSPENPNHSHSQAQLATIAMLSNVVATTVSNALSLGVCFAFVALIGVISKNHISQLAEQRLSLRAPPAIAI